MRANMSNRDMACLCASVCVCVCVCLSVSVCVCLSVCLCFLLLICFVGSTHHGTPTAFSWGHGEKLPTGTCRRHCLLATPANTGSKRVGGQHREKLQCRNSTAHTFRGHELSMLKMLTEMELAVNAGDLCENQHPKPNL